MARISRGVPGRPVVTRPPFAGPLGGTGTIALDFALSGSGTPHFSGTGTITLNLTPAGTGTPRIDAEATLDLDFGLDSSGTKTTGIGTPSRPRTRWQLIAGPATGGHDRALTEATARRYTARLVEPSELSFNLDGRHPQALAVDELTTDVHLLWTSDTGTTEILDRCRVGAPQDSIDRDRHTMQVNCLDYKAVLRDARRLTTGDTVTYTGADQAEIAWGLVDSTQNNTGGGLGISRGWTGTTPTGQLRDRTYAVGDSIGERVQELSEVIDGFDWDITPVSASALRMDVWYPQRGVDRGVVLEHGGLVAAATRDVNTSGYANALRYTGWAGDDITAGPNPVELEVPDLATRPEGRFDAVFGDEGLLTQEALDDRAAWQFAQSQVIQPVYTVALRQGAWGGPHHIWLGDSVQLVVMSGRLAVNTVLRVYEVEISLDGAGGESVTLSLGGPRPNFNRRASETDRRLANLERR